jgi:hypothetical protein
MTILESYFSALRDIRSSGEAVDETSYYVPLANFFNEVGKSLKPRVHCVLTLKNRGAGIPDGGLFIDDQIKKSKADAKPLPQNPARGVIEIKPTADDAWTIADGEQVSRYWGKYGQVLVTNYRDFVFVGKDPAGNPVKLESYRLADSEADFWKAAATPKRVAAIHEATFIEFAKRAMLHAAPIAAPEDLAWFLASYARDALHRISLHELPALANVRKALEEALGLTFEGKKGEHFFRSTLVQTLFYGVFSAWVLWSKQSSPGPVIPNGTKNLSSAPPLFNWRLTTYYLRVPVLRKLFHEVAEPGQLDKLNLSEILDWTSAALNRVDRSAFFSKFQEVHAVQYFYEPFLQAFDPELRKQLGVWYTPPEIVEYMVARVDTVLREQLGLADGLADKNVYVLDPCCGTGSYLVEVLKRIHRTLRERGNDALIAADLKEAAQNRVYGFEILPAPFVVAHLQLGLLLQNFGAPLAEKGTERVGVYLTNALTGWEPPKEPKKRLLFPELQEERDAAEHVKRSTPILVVLGNPPYNAFAGVSPVEEEGLLDPYKAGLKEWGITKNYLDDLYVRFFRVAERRVAEVTDRGIVCFISSFSYLGDPSFVVMREKFLKEFDAIWFDCMNGDSRETGKLTPDGESDPSVFSTQYKREGIRVGTAVALMCRTPVRAARATVRFRNFWGKSKRADLVASLNARDFNSTYELLEPKRPNKFVFKPYSIKANYEAWPSVVQLAAIDPMLGLNENRAGALQCIDRAELEERMRKYLDKETNWGEVELLSPQLAKPAAGYDPPEVRRKVTAAEKFDTQRIVPYLRRPFDVVWAYISDVSPLWNRSRPELRRALAGMQFALITRPAQDASPEGFPIFATNLLGEQDAIRGHAYYFPAAFHIRPKKAKAAHSRQAQLIDIKEDDRGEALAANLSGPASQYVEQLTGPRWKSVLDASRSVWLHALAIGQSRAYLSDNAHAIRDGWPRIPLPDSKRALLASAELGGEIAALLDTTASVSGITVGTPHSALKSVATITRSGGGLLVQTDLALTAGWGHAGKGGVTMPGRGSLLERKYSATEQKGIVEGSSAVGISGKKALELLGEKTYDIYLNEVAYWSNIPEKVWEYTIGGYQVIKKWLSYREQPLLGRTLTIDEVRYVQEMARRIAAILLLGPALDANYEAVKDHAFAWPPKR